MLSTDEADEAQNQYEAFVESDCKLHRDEFLKFDISIDRVGVFLGNYLHKVGKYTALWKVGMIVFLLSHGQATIVRGFSVNKEVVEVNMEELSLIFRRIIYDELTPLNVKVHKYQVTADLIKRSNQSYKHYKAYLAERKDTVQCEEKS